MFSQNCIVRPKCPYKEKCYRRNPIHFSEMSHPHLEKLLGQQLDGEIQIPSTFDFECQDVQVVRDQLKILQMVLRKERNSTKPIGNKSENEETEKQSGSSNTDINNSSFNKCSEDFKAKIERNRQAAVQRRENKLKELDMGAAKLTAAKEGNYNATSSSKNTCVSQDNDDDDVIILDCRGKDEYSKAKKRHRENSTENKFNSKRTKPGDSSSSSKSIFEIYESATSRQSRREIRQKAIEAMRFRGLKVSVVEPGNFAIKYALSAPYHIFFSRVEMSRETFNQQNSITVPEILDISLGEIESSLQLNFMVDIGWICLQYLLAGQSTKMTVIYGERVDTETLPPSIKLINVKPSTRFGCHHSKIMILKYKDESIRIVISTANLYSDDWENRTQGLWISPRLPRLPDSANPGEGESPTNFKKDFERYLLAYSKEELTEWVFCVRRADFSDVNVFFIASVPGKYTGSNVANYGHKKLGSVLSKYATLPADAPQWTLIAQSSSIGSLGPNYESWISTDILSSMSKVLNEGLQSQPNFRFVYPSQKNYEDSFDCRNASLCLPYSWETHKKQMWLESYLYQWKASHIGRDGAMPHIKTYMRVSPDLHKIPWFVLTSANLSKAAWGWSPNAYTILNYEAGVAFLPKFVTNTTTFPIVEEEANSPIPVFPIAYDLPLTRYTFADKPFMSDFLK